MENNNNKKIRKISLIAFFSAVSAILMFFDFPLPIAPSFMKMDLSELPVMIGGFILGPISCIAISILKVLIKFIIKGTSTMFLGELANIVGSIAYALPSCIIYSTLKNKKRAVLGLIIGTISSSIICTLFNLFFLFPLYMNLFHMSEDVIIGMCHAILPFIDSMIKVMFFSVFPFNILKFGITSVITYMLYKHVSKITKEYINK